MYLGALTHLLHSSRPSPSRSTSYEHAYPSDTSTQRLAESTTSPSRRLAFPGGTISPESPLFNVQMTHPKCTNVVYKHTTLQLRPC